MTTFDEIDRIFNRMSGIDSLLEGFGMRSAPLYYGCTVAVGPDGRPHIQEYGNACVTCQPEDAGSLVDTIVDDKAGLLKLVAEMPGVEKQDIDVTVQDEQIEISAQRGEKKYHATVPTRNDVDPDSAKATYKNGVLEVSFKLVHPTPSGKKLEVN